MGVNCKYNGGNNLTKEVLNIIGKETIIPVCPEQLGGCPTPRTPVEIQNGDGARVLDLKSKVCGKNGVDVTDNFIKGANEVLKLAKMNDISRAILKARSPSCGKGCIYDGSFSGIFKKGNGVTAELLLRNGIEVYTEEELKALKIKGS